MGELPLHQGLSIAGNLLQAGVVQNPADISRAAFSGCAFHD